MTDVHQQARNAAADLAYPMDGRSKRLERCLPSTAAFVRYLRPLLDQTWRQEAACRGLNPDLFYPEQGVPIDDAQAVCGRCPVRVQCHDVGSSEQWGVWGGESAHARREVRAGRRT